MCTSCKYCENFAKFRWQVYPSAVQCMVGVWCGERGGRLTPDCSHQRRGRGRRSLTWPRLEMSHVTHWDTCHVAPTLHTGTRGTCHVAPHSGTRVTITIRGSASRSCVIHCELKLPCYKPDLTAAATCAMWRVTCLVWRVVRTMVRVGAEEIWLITRGTADPAPDQRYK